MTSHSWRGVLVAAAVGLLAAVPVTAAEGQSLVVSAGSYDVTKDGILEGGLEARAASRAWGLVPVAGLSGNEDGAFWGYAGLQRPVRFGRGWRLTPGFAIALYEEGDGKDLGGPLEFRSSIELSRRFAGGSSLGVVFYHLSNAGIYDDNPGSNSLVVTFAFPVSLP